MHFASIHIPPSKPGCISHTCIFCPASQDAFHIHVYSAQQARMHFVHVYSAQQLRVLFAHMYILPSKPGCILHTFNNCLTSQGAFCIDVYSPSNSGSILHSCLFCLTSQGAFYTHLYSAQQARVHFIYMYCLLIPACPFFFH